MSHQEPENNNLGTSIREGFKYREVHFKIMRLAGGTRGKRLCDPESRNCRKPSLPCQGSSEPTLHCFHWARQPCSSTDHCPSRDLAHRSLCLIQAPPRQKPLKELALMSDYHCSSPFYCGCQKHCQEQNSCYLLTFFSPSTNEMDEGGWAWSWVTVSGTMCVVLIKGPGAW